MEAQLIQRLLAAGLARFVAPKRDSIEAKLIQRLHAACAGQSAGRGGKHVLIACVPKSSSTFLTNAIANLPDFNNVGLGFLYGRREQELCLFRCSLVHDLNYVTQAHVRFSNSTESILKTFDIFPVILVRNIFDCVVSICDHLHNKSLEGSMAYFPPRILEEPREKQYDAIIDLMVPWYANFFACWSDYKGPGLRFRMMRSRKIQMRSFREPCAKLATKRAQPPSTTPLRKPAPPLLDSTSENRVGARSSFLPSRLRESGNYFPTIRISLGLKSYCAYRVDIFCGVSKRSYPEVGGWFGSLEKKSVS